MPSIGSAYRGPLVIIGLGSGFSVVGAVPVAITFSIGVRTSATIIGMGFVGFGFLLILPGLFWCLTVRAHSFKFWRRRKRTPSEEEETTPTLNCSISSKSDVRERHWPPCDYNSAPPLLISSSSSSYYDHKTTTTSTTTNCSDVLLVNADISATPIRRDSCTRPRAEGFTGDTLVTAADGALKYSKDTQADDEFCVCRQDVGGCIGGEEEEEEEERLKPATKAASAAVETEDDEDADEVEDD